MQAKALVLWPVQYFLEVLLRKATVPSAWSATFMRATSGISPVVYAERVFRWKSKLLVLLIITHVHV